MVFLSFLLFLFLVFLPLLVFVSLLLQGYRGQEGCYNPVAAAPFLPSLPSPCGSEDKCTDMLPLSASETMDSDSKSNKPFSVSEGQRCCFLLGQPSLQVQLLYWELMCNTKESSEQS